MLVIAVVVYGFQQTAITPALPVVQQDFGASREWTAWLFSGYLIVASVTPVLLGKLADRSGKRRIFIASLLVFLLGSIGAAFSSSIAMLVTFRVIQGVGGVVFPLSFSIARDELAPRRLSAGIGLLAGGFGAGSVAGYVLGGLIAELMSWRWIFGIGAIALALALPLVRFMVPRSPVRQTRRLDMPGGLLFGAAMASLIVAITEGPQRGWGSAIVVGAFGAGVMCALAWLIRELHTSEPMLDLRVLRSRTILLTNIAGVLGGYTLFGANMLLPFLIQDGDGRSNPLTAFGLVAGPLLTGLVLLPRALGQVVSSPWAARLSARFGTEKVLAAGLLLMAGSSGVLAIWRSQPWMLMLALAAMGLGFGLVVSVSGTIVTSTVDIGDTGIATSINSVLRRMGGAIGAQVAAAFIANPTSSAAGGPEPTGFTIAFAIGFVASAIGAALAAAITNRQAHPSGAESR